MVQNTTSMVTFKEGFSLKNPNSHSTVILFHGLTSTPSEMEVLAEKLLACGFNVECPRLMGHGRSIEEMRLVSTRYWLKDAESALERIRDRDIFVAGCSFGSLLALHLASSHEQVKAAVLMSTPMRLRSEIRENLLKFISYFPDNILNKLGVVKKRAREQVKFKRERNSYSHHSIAAGARLMQVRRVIRKNISKLKCPILGIFDPNDHHLNQCVAEELSELVGTDKVELSFLPGAEHELTIGPEEEKVSEIVCQFFREQQCLEK